MIEYREDTYERVDRSVKSFDPEGLHKFFEYLGLKMEEAEGKGWKRPRVLFESTLEPYEDYPGEVEVTIVGFRKKTQHELKIEEEQRVTEELAQKLGVTFYEASVLQRLQTKLNSLC